MEARLALSIVGFLTAFSSAALFAAWVIEAFRRSRLRSAAQLDASGLRAWALLLLRNGFPALGPVAKALCEKPSVRKVMELWVRALRSRGWSTSVAAFSSVALALCLAAFLAMTLVSRSLLGGLLGVVLAAAVLVIGSQSWQEHQDDALRDAVPEALKAMEACSQTGLSLEQMLRQVGAESPKELGRLFQESASVMETGGTASQALSRLREGTRVPELAFVSVALDVQHQTGGSLRQVLRAAYDMVESELELRRQLQVQTAQARLSARVVTIMPFILAALLTLVSKDFLAPFFSSFAGLAVLAVALLMQLAGVLIVRRMLKVSE